MTYVYTLNQKDIGSLGLKPTHADEYSIEQSGWTGSFSDLHEVVENEFGKFKGEVVISGTNLTNEQVDYITKNCNCMEH